MARGAQKNAYFAMAVALYCLTAANPTHANSAWDDIRPAVFGNRAIADGSGLFAFNAPYRAEDQRAVPLSVDAAFRDGRKVKSVTFVIDENPMPVAAVFRFADNRDRAALTVNIRLDHASPVRTIVEASDGALYMIEKFVKASGLGVCAAPPIGDESEIARTMGQMRFTDLTGTDESISATRFRRSAALDIQHPQNTGMQKNQITLLYIPLRYISTIEVRQGGDKLFDLDGSISMSENPHIEFDYRVNGAAQLRVTAKDTSDSVWNQVFSVGPQG
jgi:sulfur-oxidizing protein SoxY